MKNVNLYNVDWTKIPEPKGGEDLSHLIGFTLPDVILPDTGGNDIDLRKLNELTVIIYILSLGNQTKNYRMDGMKSQGQEDVLHNHVVLEIIINI